MRREWNGMSSVKLLGVGALLAILTVGAGIGTRRYLSASQPRVAPLEVVSSKDLGTLFAPSKAEFAVVLKNRSHCLLSINNVLTSCGCTTVSIPHRDLPPNECISIPVQYNSFGKSGSQLILLHVLLASKEVFPVPIHVNVVPQPESHIALQPMRDDQISERLISLPDDLKSAQLVLKSAEFDSRKITIRSVNVHNGVNIFVKPNPQIGRRPFSENLIVRTNSRVQPVSHFEITGELLPYIDSSPREVSLDNLEIGQPFHTVISVLSPYGRSFSIQSIDYDPTLFRVSWDAKAIGVQHSIQCVLCSSAKAEAVSTRLVAHTDDSRQPRIEIPIYGMIVTKT